LEPRIFPETEIRLLTEAATRVAPIVSEARMLDRFQSIAPRPKSGSGRWLATYGGAGITIPPALFRDPRSSALESAQITVRSRC